uniref:hypothetical protein n=1 Tax=Pontibacterium sp. TaxID=2036026 RepID=UPI0035129904
EEIEVTWRNTLQIWWSWCWRSALWTFISVFLVGTAIGLSFGVLGISQVPYRVFIDILYGVIGLAFGLSALKVVLSKEFRGYRIVLVKTNEEPADLDA